MRNDLPEIWTNENLLSSINSNSSLLLKSSFIFDPHEILSYSINDTYYMLSNLNAQNISTYLMILNKTDSSFDVNYFKSQYKFPPEVDLTRILIILIVYSENNWNLNIGTSLESIYTEEFISEIKEKIKKESPSEVKENAIRIIVNYVRNRVCVPQEHWTPKNLGEYYENDIGFNQTYSFYDPELTVNRKRITKYNHYFEEYNNVSVNIFFIITNELNKEYKDKPNTFTDEFINNYFKFEEEIKKEDSLFLFLSVEEKYFNITFGSNVKKITDETFKKISAVIGWDNIDFSVDRIVHEIRFYILGELYGWDTSLLINWLENNRESYKEKKFFFSKQDFTDYEYKRLDNITMDSYSQTHFEEMSKIKDSYTSLNEFMVEYENKIGVKFEQERKMIIFVLINNDHYIEIIMGDKHKKSITEDEVNEIKKNTSQLFKSDTEYKAIKFLLTNLRYMINMRNNEWTAKNIINYYLDFVSEYPKDKYSICDQNETIPKNNLTVLNDYVNDLNSTNQHTMIFVIDKLTNKTFVSPSYYTLQLMYELSHTVSGYQNMTYQMHIILYVFESDEYGLWFISGEKYNYTLRNSVREKIVNETKAINVPIEKIKYIYKNIRLITVLNILPWNSKRLLDYFSDFLNNPECAVFFDPGRIFSEEENFHKLNIYVNNLKEYDYHLFVFILMNHTDDSVGNEENSDKILEEFADKYKYPSGTNKNNSLFIALYPDENRIGSCIGSKYDKIITEDILLNALKDAIKYFEDSGYFDGMKVFLREIRNEILFKSKGVQEKWNPNSLASIYNKNIHNEDFYIFDFYTYVNESSSDFLIESYEQFYDDYDINIFSFLINEIEDIYKKDKEKFINEFMSNFSYELNTIDKNNILFLIYSKNDNLLIMKGGKNTSNILPYGCLEDLSSEIIEEHKDNEYEILDYSLNKFITAVKNFHIWTTDEIKNYAKKNTTQKQYILFDMQKNLNSQNTLNIYSVIRNLSKNDTYVFTFILPGSPENISIDQFTKDLIQDYPMDDVAKNNTAVFLVYFTNINVLNISLYKENKYLNYGKVKEFFEEAQKKMNDNLYEGLVYALNKIKEYNVDRRKEKTNNTLWIVLSIGLGVLLIIIIVIIVLFTCFFKRSKFSTNIMRNNKEIAISDVKAEPLENNDII